MEHIDVIVCAKLDKLRVFLMDQDFSYHFDREHTYYSDIFSDATADQYRRMWDVVNSGIWDEEPPEDRLSRVVLALNRWSWEIANADDELVTWQLRNLGSIDGIIKMRDILDDYNRDWLKLTPAEINKIMDEIEEEKN